MNKKLKSLAIASMAAGMIAGTTSCIDINDQATEYNDNSIIIQNNIYRSGACYGTEAYKRQQGKLWSSNGAWPIQSNEVNKNVNISNSYSKDFFNNSNKRNKEVGKW